MMKSRLLQTSAGIALAALCLAFLWALIFLSTALEKNITQHQTKIDLVIGAKGDPLQLVKTTLYHHGAPVKNISGATARIAARHPQVKTSIPLSLADNINGYRIVGTTEDYLTLYGAELAAGTLWDRPMQAIAGAETNLKIGDNFFPRHGYSKDDPHHDHKAHQFEITGILAPTGTIIDKLILTSVQSIYEIHNVIPDDHDHDHDHAHSHEHKHDHNHDHNHTHSHHHDHGHNHDEEPHSHGPEVINHEVTALLIQTHAPLSQINFPQEINRTSNLTAAAPEKEISTLRRRFALGRESLMITAITLSALTMLMILCTLAANILARHRKAELPPSAPWFQFLSVLCEGFFMGIFAGIVGLLAGRFIASYIVRPEAPLHVLVIEETIWHWGIGDIKLLFLAVSLGAGAALVPALTTIWIKK